MNPEYIEGENRKRCMYFVPSKRNIHTDIRICDHAVERFTERFPNSRGNTRAILKAILCNGRVELSDGPGNMVVHRDGVFCIVSGNKLRTVYTERMFQDRKDRIMDQWHREVDSDAEGSKTIERQED